MNICIIDNYDSFTFNLLDEFVGPAHKVHVWRNSMSADEVERRIFELDSPRLLVFSPGPGHPNDAGCMNELITRLASRVPMFGVCLGMQAMVSVFGGVVSRAPAVVHGKARLLEHNCDLIFKGLKDRIYVGRYHSLAASKVPEDLHVFGYSDGQVMAISHKIHPIIGIQFHPESILSTQGSQIIKNVLSWALGAKMREVELSGNISNEKMLEQLILGSIPEGFVTELIRRILDGSMNSYQVAASLVLLRAKGESGSDLAEAAELVLSKAQTLDQPDYIFGDIVGTGGDGHDTINISTLASLTAASVGMPVAKHGNVSVSSRCGSADVLGELGLNLSIDSLNARKSLNELNWCFLFAPTYHPSFKAISEVRKLLKIKTIFNILGPLVNPWRPQIIVMGVYEPRFIRPCAEALQKLGLKKALVIHGSGLDEIALHGPTIGAILENSHISNFSVNPSDLGLKNYNLEEIRGADPAQNASEFKNLLAGEGSAAKIAMIAASAGALLWLGGFAENLKGGVFLAHEALNKGKPRELFKKILEINHA